jgi:hypothetical protein
MKNINAKKILGARPIPKLVVWIMRKLAEAERRKWRRSPEYDAAAQATHDIIENNRAQLDINAGESELNHGR